VLALGPSTCPKNARDLTFQPFVGIMGANRSSCFVLSGDIVKGGSTGIWKFVGSPGVEADGFPQVSFAEQGQLLGEGCSSIWWEVSLLSSLNDPGGI
jgi:hypothetical protein